MMNSILVRFFSHIAQLHTVLARSSRQRSRAGSVGSQNRREFCRWPKSEPDGSARDDKTPLTVFSSSDADGCSPLGRGGTRNSRLSRHRRTTYCLKIIGSRCCEPRAVHFVTTLLDRHPPVISSSSRLIRLPNSVYNLLASSRLDGDLFD